jgi:hypothetical protein
MLPPAMADATIGGGRGASRAGGDGATRRADGCCHRRLQMLPAYDQRGRMLRPAELQAEVEVLQAGVAKSVPDESFLFYF